MPTIYVFLKLKEPNKQNEKKNFIFDVNKTVLE
jgi:hypothetical protein